MFHLSPSNIVISVIILLVSCSFGIYKIIFLLLLLFVCLCGLLSSAMVTEKSSSYNIGHHNQDHSVGVPQLLEEMEGQTSKQRIQHYIGDFKDINDVLQEMLDLTYRDYMKPWHQVIKNDNSLQISISNSITHVFKALSYRASQVDLVPYLTTRLVDDFATHIRLYRGSLNHIKEHGPHKDIEEVFFDMEKQMDGKRSREAVCCNNKALNQYLRELTGVLLFLLLPPEDFNNNILTYLLREVLLSTVLTPTLDYITDPDNINYYMALPCRDETFTHECFLSILRSSKSIEELLAVKEKVEEDIAKQRSQDSGGEDDTLIKQRLSSLLFLQSTVLSLINNIRTGDDKKSPSTPDPRGNNFTFDDLLNDHKALTYFIDFLTSKGMQHYLFFYLTVESYKVSAEQQISASLLTTAGPHQVDMDTLYEAAFSIFNQYLSDKASPCIKLDSMLVDIVMSRIKHGDAMESIFDDVQAKVYEAMQDDPSCFPSFKLSPYFNKLINQLQPSLLSDNDPGFVNDGGDINRNNNKNSNKDFYDGVDPNEGIINGYGEDLKGDNNDTTMTTTTNKNKNVKKTTFTSGNENKEDDCSVIPGIFVIDEEEHNIGSNNNDNIDGKNNNGNIEINVNKQDIIKIHSSKSNFELNASKFVSNLGINNNVINKNLLLTSHSLTKSLNSLVINDNKIKDNNNTDNNISINKSILNGSVKSLHSSTVNNKDNKNRLLLNFPGLIKASSLGNMVSNNNGNNNLCKNTSANKISSSVSSSKSTLTNLKNSNSPLVTTSAALSANTASSTKTDKKSSLLPTSFSKPPSTLSLSSTNKSRLSKQTSSSSPPSKQPTSLPLPPSNKTSSSPNQASSPPSCTQHSTTPTTRTSASNVPSSLTNSLSVGDLNPMDKPSHRSNRDSPDGKGSHNFSLHAHISNTGICKEHGKPYSVYLITVEEIYPHTHAHQDTQDHKWFIYRRFSDFYNLHSTLLSRYNNINSLILPNRRPFDNMNKEFLERRRVGLNMYLQTLVKLAPLNSYPGLFELVHAFLQPQWERGKSDLSRKVDYFVNPFRSSVRSVGNMVKAVPNSLFDNMVKVRNIPGNMIGGVGRMLSVKTTETQPQKNLKVGASLDIEVSEDNIPLHIMLLLMDEVFDLKNRNQWLRRRIVALLQQLVKTMFGDSINRKIVECVVAYTSSEAFAGYLRLLKESVWPNGRRAPAAQERTHSDKMRRRVVCKSKLLGNVSDEFKHIINSDTTRQGVTLVFDLFQEVNLNKRLALVVLEGLLETLFPDNKFPETFVRLHSSLNINNNNNKNNNNNTRNKENNTNNKNNNNTNNTRSKDNNSNIKNNLEKSKSFGNNNNNNNNDLDNKNINNHKNLKSSYSINPAFQKS